MSTFFGKRPKQRSSVGIPMFIISSVFLAFMATTVKSIRDVGTTTEAIIFMRNFTSLILLMPWIFFFRQSIPLKEKFKTSAFKLHLIRSLCSFAAVYLYFFSLRYLNLSTATLLWNTIPIFIPLVTYFWKKLAIQHLLWWGLGVSFAGILVILNPGTQVFHPAALLALLSGVIGAVAFVSMRYSHFTDKPEAVLFYLFLLNTIFSGIFSLLTFKNSWQSINTHTLLLMILIGIFGLLYQIFLTIGSKFVPVRLGSIFIYFSVIFTMILDKWIWQIPISPPMYIGFGLIVLGSLLLVLLYPKDDYKTTKR